MDKNHDAGVLSQATDFLVETVAHKTSITHKYASFARFGCHLGEALLIAVC
jgi:hypothetical protein